MKMKTIQIVFLFFMVVSLNAQPLSPRQAAMGGITTIIDSKYHPLDLYGFGSNYAWLQESDSLTWGRYQLQSINEWGNLHRQWDAAGVHQNGFIFTGQKRLSDTQLFYGRIAYNRDFYDDVHQAIEANPYAHDPFVLTDTTTGDFSWYGPQVQAVFSQRIFADFFLGLSVNYGIQRGFKAQNSMPEIISRAISASVDLAYRLNSNMEIGVSFRPFDRQDITKLASLPDGTAPLIRRYRGETIYSEYLTKDDRTANYNGHEERLQFSLHTETLRLVAFGGYHYLWHELFDGNTQHNYNGFFQDESYFFKTALQNYWNRFAFGMRYGLQISKNWAKEPVADLRIYDARYFSQSIRVGVSYHTKQYPLIWATEFLYDEKSPTRNDYLTKSFRQGKNKKWEWRGGLEINTNAPFKVRAGYLYTSNNESAVWNYFGNYKGPAFTAGAAYYGETYEVGTNVLYKMFARNHTNMQSLTRRQHFYIEFSLQQYF